MELPPQFLETEWPFATEIDALRRVHSLRTAVDAKLRTLALDFRAHRLHARRTELRTLQLRVHHTFTPPVAAVGEDADAPTTPGAPGRWTLHLQAVDASDASATPVNLVHYFRKVSIELDPRLYSDAMVEWTCFQRGNHDAHKLEVSRAGHTPHSVRIKLQPSHVVERYVLSDALRSALAAFVANPHAQSFTKPDVLLAVWEYIKRRNLIKEDDCRVAVCDATLRQLFQCDSLPFTSIVVALKPHLTPAPPLDVEYQLSLELPTDAEPETPLDEKVVLVDVGHVDEVERARELALQAWDELQQEQQKELALLQRQEALLLSQLDACHRKHEWLQQFAHDPAGFVADVAASQQSDMEILTSEAETDEINVPHANQFSQPWVREVVADLLIPPPAN